MRKDKLIVVNLFAGPSAGKSTTAAGVYSKLKKKLVRAELITEVAKDYVWEDHKFALTQQISIFAAQLRRQNRLIGKRAVAITDSPLLLASHLYNKEWDTLRPLGLEAWERFDNLNFYVVRNKPFDPEGRNEKTLGEGRLKDIECLTMLNDLHLPFENATGDDEGEDAIVDYVIAYLRAQGARR